MSQVRPALKNKVNIVLNVHINRKAYATTISVVIVSGPASVVCVCGPSDIVSTAIAVSVSGPASEPQTVLRWFSPGQSQAQAALGDPH